MSLVQVLLDRHTVMVAVDTMGVLAGDAAGASRRGGKLVALPHLPAVVAYRGLSFIAGGLASALLTAEAFDPVADGLVKIMQELEDLNAAYLDQAPSSEKVETLKEAARLDFELFLAGWSANLDRPRAVLVRKPAGEPFDAELVEIEKVCLAPSQSDDPDAPCDMPWTALEQLATARRQVARLRAGGFPSGGDLLIAKVDRVGVTTELIRDFYDEDLDAPPPNPRKPNGPMGSQLGVVIAAGS